jgi:hypothetical protein
LKDIVQGAYNHPKARDKFNLAMQEFSPEEQGQIKTAIEGYAKGLLKSPVGYNASKAAQVYGLNIK